jgi:hypothetical protein
MTRVTVVRFEGVDLDERNAQLLGIVMKYATSGDSDARETRRAALKKLGESGCTAALTYIIDKLATSGDSDARETRRMAMEML